MPRFPFDKFVLASNKLGTQMKATGEVMAIAPSLEQALMKAIRSLEENLDSLQMDKLTEYSTEKILEQLNTTSGNILSWELVDSELIANIAMLNAGIQGEEQLAQYLSTLLNH